MTSSNDPTIEAEASEAERSDQAPPPSDLTTGEGSANADDTKKASADEGAEAAALPRAFWEGLEQELPACRQILERMSHRFPSSGIDAMGQALRLASLVDRMLLWEAVLHGDAPFDDGLFALEETYGDSSEGQLINDRWLTDPMWERLEQRWPRALPRIAASGSADDLGLYPLQLRAFGSRHRALLAAGCGEFGDNDLELERLWRPAHDLLRALELALWKWRSEQPSEASAESGWRRWLFWLVVAGVIGGYVISGWGQGHQRPSQTLPKGAIAGGIQGSYYQGTQFQHLEQRRTDEGIWFHWQASPITNVTANYFSIRWSGFLRVPKQGRYKLCLHHDDGATLRVGQQALLTHWRPGKDSVHCADTTLGRGWHRLVVHMFDRYGPAVAKLSWQPPGAPNPKRVPASHLCCRNL